MLTNLRTRSKASFRYRLQHFLRGPVTSSLHTVYGIQPVPFRLVSLLNRLTQSLSSNLANPAALVHKKVLSTENSELNRILDEVYRQQDEWIICSSTLDVVSQYIWKGKPRCIVEFGSGISTLWLAYHLSQMHSRGSAKLLSIEQDVHHLQQTGDMLSQIGLADFVELIHAPKDDVTIHGHQIVSYSGLGFRFEEYLQPYSVGMVLIDGPSGGGQSRFGTLPHLKSYMKPGAQVLLDDALRPNELHVAKMWLEEGLIRADGVIFVERGLFVGKWK